MSAELNAGLMTVTPDRGAHDSLGAILKEKDSIFVAGHKYIYYSNANLSLRTAAGFVHVILFIANAIFSSITIGLIPFYLDNARTEIKQKAVAQILVTIDLKNAQLKVKKFMGHLLLKDVQQARSFFPKGVLTATNLKIDFDVNSSTNCVTYLLEDENEFPVTRNGEVGFVFKGELLETDEYNPDLYIKGALLATGDLDVVKLQHFMIQNCLFVTKARDEDLA